MPLTGEEKCECWITHCRLELDSELAIITTSLETLRKHLPAHFMKSKKLQKQLHDLEEKCSAHHQCQLLPQNAFLLQLHPAFLLLHSYLHQGLSCLRVRVYTCRVTCNTFRYIWTYDDNTLSQIHWPSMTSTPIQSQKPGEAIEMTDGTTMPCQPRGIWTDVGNIGS